jgi:DNA mismatch repair ATPase MutS
MWNNPVLYLLLAGLIVGIIELVATMRRRKLSKRLKQLRDGWGKATENQLSLEYAKKYFLLADSISFKNSYCIDDDTWQDLNLDEVFKLIDRTISPVGSQYLFNLLRHPLLEDEILAERDNLINSFSNNEDLRVRVQQALQGLKNDDAKYIPHLLWEPLPDKPAFATALPLVSLLSLSVLLLVVLNVVHYIALIPVFFFNFILRSYLKRNIELFVGSFQYLGILINAADRLSKLGFNELNSIQINLKDSLKETRIIGKRISALQFKDDIGIIEYLNIFFLLDISIFYSVIGRIERNIKELRAIYEAVGYLDSLIAVASFRLQYNNYCKPEFLGNNENCKVQNAYNPLLIEPIPNSFEFNLKNALITGSNMAGKTTFLKTMGLNAVLAQTINMSFAGRYEAPFIKVMSSIGRADNLVLGKSYYYAEVESILRLIKASQTDNIHLFVLDEIFRGTNSIERLAASIEVLRYLANNKDYILVATHDLQLTEELNAEYSNYHFREKVCDAGLEFDYKLHGGPSTTRNAIALLDYVGYPKSIVKNAVNRIT